MMGISHDDLCCLCESNLETIEHLFLYCQQTLQCWIFIEMLLKKKYHNNKFIFINDCYRILGYGRYMDDIGLFLTGNMLKTIWYTRCQLSTSDNNDTRGVTEIIIDKFKGSLKKNT